MKKCLKMCISVILIFSVLLFLNSFGQPVQAAESNLGDEEQLMVDLINQKRILAQLPSLQVNPVLVKIARRQTNDLMENQDYKANLITTGTLAAQLKANGITYQYATESITIAASFNQARNAWAKSTSYQQTITSKKYNCLGVGVVKDKTYVYLVQIFIGKQNALPADLSSSPTQPVSYPPLPSPVSNTNPSPASPVALVPTPPPAQNTFSPTVDEQKMINLVNAQRAKYGLAPLKVNPDLTRVARLKAQDMLENNYFSHTSPTYGSPFNMLRQFNISYSTAAENLAGAPTVEMAHESLMNSPGHRANILNPNLTDIGIGVVSGGIYGKIFVQMFTG
ncbi:MAG TPA: sporulation protein [Desulfotomaculum sp.]|nr:sporulation protein [Desulfotomaculum sp.]